MAPARAAPCGPACPAPALLRETTRSPRQPAPRGSVAGRSHASPSPELVQLDRQGYPVFLDMPVPFWLERGARQAVAMCPALALRVEPARPLPAPGRPAIAPA